MENLSTGVYTHITGRQILNFLDWPGLFAGNVRLLYLTVPLPHTVHHNLMLQSFYKGYFNLDTILFFPVFSPLANFALLYPPD
jgi:hypothetical protein